jgi:hypothetical protein
LRTWTNDLVSPPNVDHDVLVPLRGIARCEGSSGFRLPTEIEITSHSPAGRLLPQKWARSKPPSKVETFGSEHGGFDATGLWLP